MSSLFPDFGNLLYTVGAFVLALSVIVAVHEYGHYIVGRWSGIKADVFSLGFGPKLFSRVDKHGTRWQFALIPLGGYVKFRGDANAASAGGDEAALAEMTPEQKRETMHGAPLWARAATVAAGPVFNFILSTVLFAGVMLWAGTATNMPVIGKIEPVPSGVADLRVGDEILSAGGVETPDWDGLRLAIEALPDRGVVDMVVRRNGEEIAIKGPHLFPARFAGVAPSSAVVEAGLMIGDVVIRANEETIYSFTQLQEAVKASDGAPIALKVWRPASGSDAAREFDVELQPKRTDLPAADGGFETRWLIGATGGFVFEPETRPTTVWEAVSSAVGQVGAIITGSLTQLRAMIFGEIDSCNLRGAIGIAESSAVAASSGIENFIWFIAALSTAVGFLNLLPIPVLDGGHLIFHAYEAIAGKPPSEKIYGLMMGIGLVLILSLMLFGLSNDIFCP
ncbi:RIP metalloprotease RseP [Albirhodobacter sp. R86504]|uniref:RIP metalloprotease RseP n=1 Tax=Albirhodobacter sp. R86504 TaxID=3093848 RepID=UPI003671C65D